MLPVGEAFTIWNGIFGSKGIDTGEVFWGGTVCVSMYCEWNDPLVRSAMLLCWCWYIYKFIKCTLTYYLCKHTSIWSWGAHAWCTNMTTSLRFYSMTSLYKRDQLIEILFDDITVQTWPPHWDSIRWHHCTNVTTSLRFYSMTSLYKRDQLIEILFDDITVQMWPAHWGYIRWHHCTNVTTSLRFYSMTSLYKRNHLIEILFDDITVQTWPPHWDPIRWHHCTNVTTSLRFYSMTSLYKRNQLIEILFDDITVQT